MGCRIHNLLFSWCPFASTATVAAGEGEEHEKGYSPVGGVKCLAMQSLMSQNRFFLWLWGLWPLLQALWLLVTRPSPSSFFCLKMKERKTHRCGETPKGKPALMAERPVEILKEGFHRKKCSVLQKSKHEIWGFQQVLKQLFCAPVFVFIRLVVNLCFCNWRVKHCFLLTSIFNVGLHFRCWYLVLKSWPSIVKCFC